MKRLIPFIIIATFLLTGCAATNMFETEAPLTAGYEHSKKYCKKHSTNYNACMDAEYLFAVQVGLIINADNLSESESRQTEKRVLLLMRKHGIHERWFSGDCSYGEWLEILNREW